MQPSYEEKKEKFSIIRKKPHHVPPHLHNAIELVYVTKGELELCFQLQNLRMLFPVFNFCNVHI